MLDRNSQFQRRFDRRATKQETKEWKVWKGWQYAKHTIQIQIQLEMAAHDCWLRPRVSRAPGAMAAARLLASATRAAARPGRRWLPDCGFGCAGRRATMAIVAHDCWVRPRVSRAPNSNSSFQVPVLKKAFLKSHETMGNAVRFFNN